MKMFNTLLRLRLRAMFAASARRDGAKKRGPGMIILLTLLFLYVAVVFLVLFASVFAVLMMALREAGESTSVYFAAAAFLSFALCIIGSVFMTQAELYQAKDNEQLLALPIRPSLILLSRMALLLIINLLFSAVVTVPAFAIYLALGAPTLGGVLAFLLLFLLVPFLALAVSCFLGWLIALVSSRMKHKNIVSLVFMLLLFGGYMWIMLGMQRYMENMIANIGAVIAAVSPYLTVFHLVGWAIGEGNFLAGLGFVALCVALCGIVMFFLSRSYIRIMTTKRAGVRYEYREKAAHVRGRMSALVRRELGRFTSSASYMMNAGVGLLFIPVIGVLAVIKGPGLADALAEEGLAEFAAYLPPVMAVMLCFMSCMVIISAASVSLEGKTIWIAQSLPLRPSDVLLAKVLCHIVVASPFFLVGSVLCAIAARAGIMDTIALILLPLAANAFCAFLGVALNVRFPKLDWINEANAVKSGAAPTLTLFIAMFASFLTGGGVALLIVVGMPTWLAVLVFTAIYAAVSAALYGYLQGKGARRFAAL